MSLVVRLVFSSVLVMFVSRTTATRVEVVSFKVRSYCDVWNDICVLASRGSRPNVSNVTGAYPNISVLVNSSQRLIAFNFKQYSPPRPAL